MKYPRDTFPQCHTCANSQAARATLAAHTSARDPATPQAQPGEHHAPTPARRTQRRVQPEPMLTLATLLALPVLRAYAAAARDLARHLRR